MKKEDIEMLLANAKDCILNAHTKDESQYLTLALMDIVSILEHQFLDSKEVSPQRKVKDE